MKVTKRQLRRLIREAVNEAEFYDETPEGQLVGTEAEDARFRQQVAGEKLAKAGAQKEQLLDAIFDLLGDNPGIAGLDVVAAIQSQPAFRRAKKNHVFDALEDLETMDMVSFDVEEDAWYIESQPQWDEADQDYADEKTAADYKEHPEWFN